MSTSAILLDRRAALWDAFRTVKQKCQVATTSEKRDAYYQEMDALLREIERVLLIEPKRKPPN